MENMTINGYLVNQVTANFHALGQMVLQDFIPEESNGKIQISDSESLCGVILSFMSTGID